MNGVIYSRLIDQFCQRQLILVVNKLSAVTLFVTDMKRSVKFYKIDLGMELLYGGPDSGFTSFSLGASYINLVLDRYHTFSPWGRIIFYVDDVDEFYRMVVSRGLSPLTKPQNADWQERYFHLVDPDGHELSFARPINL